jgi:hypothetical protein
VRAVLETWWHVSLDSYADDNGIDPANVPRELCEYVTASITDIKALEEAEGWAYGFGGTRLRVIDGRAHAYLAWTLEADRAAWIKVRDLDPRATARRDLVEHTAYELYHLPSLCETDAVMTARYATGSGRIRRVWQPGDRRRAQTA